MSVQFWHLFGVAVPYVLIATALWGLAAGAVKDAVHAGSLPRQTRLPWVGKAVTVPTILLAYASGFFSVAFIYGCSLDPSHVSAAMSTDPLTGQPEATASLFGLAAASWLSAGLLLVPYRWFRRQTKELLAAPAERDRAESRYRLLADHLTDLVAHHEPNGRYEWLSPSVENILGYTPEELVGRNPYDLFHPDDAERIRTESHEQILDGRQPDTVIRYRKRHKDGHWVWLESLTEPILNDAGEITRLQVTSRDITERQATEDDLHRRAYHDPLTGLANRLLFTARLDALVADPDEHYAVLYLDLDRFKAVNDTMGHAAGDDLLTQFAERLRQATRLRDTPARIGGDEFAVLLAHIATDEAAAEATRRVELALQTPFVLGATTRVVSASIGVARRRPEHQCAGDVLRDADLAAYAAKAEGRARWSAFTPALREASDRRLRLEADLDHAVERSELRVAYQPIVDLASGRLAGVEALIRWQHPTLGLLSPDTFISIAEETGRIGELDRWVMTEGLDQLDRWDRLAGRRLGLSLSVNCSAGDIHEPHFADGVRALLALSPGRAERLTIEITESLLVDDPGRASAVLQSLAGDGVRFALDDFGTGYSSLSVVHALPVDAVKIDRAFVRRMHEDEGAHEMVRTIVGFARTMGTRTVAEGIETPDQLASLIELGCDLGQGYLFALPLAPDVIGAWAAYGRVPWATHWAEAAA